MPIAEDLDNSLKAIRAGWRVEFASDAIATTDVPETLTALIRQRMRWNRDLLRVAFRKHLDLLIPRRRHGLGAAIELWQVLLMSVIANLAFPAYVALMLWFDPLLLLLLYALFLGLNAGLAVISLGAAMLMLGRRRDQEAWLMPWAPLLPLYDPSCSCAPCCCAPQRAHGDPAHQPGRSLHPPVRVAQCPALLNRRGEPP